MQKKNFFLIKKSDLNKKNLIFSIMISSNPALLGL